MRCKTAVLWWLINDQTHPSLVEDEQKIEALMPLVKALFPGINYYSITGFTKVMGECVLPTIKKRFPELRGVSAQKIKPEAMTEIVVMLPSKGYEWQDSEEWKAKFAALLAA